MTLFIIFVLITICYLLIRLIMDHSHPNHPDKPSDFDRDHAWPGFSYIIISVYSGKVKSYKSWQLNQDRKFFIEENINIINGDNSYVK